MFGTLLDYWHYTGDDQYNEMVREGLIHQFGEHLDLVLTFFSSFLRIHYARSILLSLSLDAFKPVQERGKRRPSILGLFHDRCCRVQAPRSSW